MQNVKNTFFVVGNPDDIVGTPTARIQKIVR